ncbi:TRAP transporter small permease [Hominifimenecus sp. rT4P-3]|uniref:TRAP transporter small permease n=1 Tax=Hominifimenecus sp. rT4P-3 TaxID=3242979 RepID=UPI003DA238B7
MKEKFSIKKFLNEFEIYLGTVVFLVLTVLLTIQVISRYVFNSAITWAEELAVIMFVWLIYLGVAGAVTNRKHLKIDALINAVPFRVKRVLLILDNVITFGFCAFVIFPFSQLIVNLAGSGTKTSLLRLPKAVIYSIVPFCLALTCIRLIQDTVKLTKESEKELGSSKPTIDIEALEAKAEELRRGQTLNRKESEK